MRASGIIRRVDDLGRVVIPKEIRRNMRVKEGDPLELFTEKIDGEYVLCLRKYEASFLSSLTTLADAIDDEMEDSATDEQINKIREHFNEIAKIIEEWENEG